MTSTSIHIQRCPSDRLRAKLKQMLNQVYDAIDCIDDASGDVVINVCLRKEEGIPNAILDQLPSKAESFCVDAIDSVAWICANDELGLSYAIDALGEKIGLGNYISGQFAKEPKPFSLDGWQLVDEPLKDHRILFNWHNFLSGCSGWDKEEWFEWIDRAVQHRFNGIMVHAYGNNPMLGGTINGVERTVGWLTTTNKGRDWGTQHVTDVRRLPRADVEKKNLFDGPRFGSDIAMVPDEDRAETMQKAMREVFDRARAENLNVFFSFDIAGKQDYPQEALEGLPEEAILRVEGWKGRKSKFPNPETPEGRDFIRQNVSTILKNFPQITHLVVWFRGRKTPFGDLAYLEEENFPASWKKEYSDLCNTLPPEVLNDQSCPPNYLFALRKFTQVLQDVCVEFGRADITFFGGSWDVKFLWGFHNIFPKDVGVMPLDYGIAFDTRAFRRTILAVSEERDVIPFVWPHHDDHSYMGRSYRPYHRFDDQLDHLKIKSFGIIHWLTRPLDLYFKSTCRQVWAHTKNEHLIETCRLMAEDWFGSAVAEHMAEYLYLWVTTASFFGQETGNAFIEHKPDCLKEVFGAKSRLQFLEMVNSDDLVRPCEKENLAYFVELETFFMEFFDCFKDYVDYNQFTAFKETGLGQLALDDPGIVPTLETNDAERVLKQFARHITKGRISKGEKALYYSMATRWYPLTEAMKQRFGVIPVRLKFGPTQHDPLASMPGFYTFHFETSGTLWKVLGEKETGHPVIELEGTDDMRSTAIRLESPFTIPFASFYGLALETKVTSVILGFGEPMSTGSLQLEWLDHDETVLHRETCSVKPTVEVTYSGKDEARFLRLNGASDLALCFAVFK